MNAGCEPREGQEVTMSSAINSQPRLPKVRWQEDVLRRRHTGLSRSHQLSRNNNSNGVATVKRKEEEVLHHAFIIFTHAM